MRPVGAMIWVRLPNTATMPSFLELDVVTTEADNLGCEELLVLEQI